MVQPDTPAPPIDVPGEGRLHARFKTSLGDIVAVLHENEVPRTVANFVALATGTVEWTHPQSGAKSTAPLYSGTIFHRVIPDFMIQGGDPTGTGRGGPGWRFGDEFHPELRHDKPGILSMANSGPNTNGCQFFITERPTPHLDNRHSVFGEVVENAELIGQIARVPTGPQDRPATDVVLEQIEIFRQ
jgi:peptidyl-prolyl cis-trans isomerase A (cyclophilin A)